MKIISVIQWQMELDEINQRLSSFDKADKNYYDRGVLFLKYAKKICVYWKALKGDSYDEKILKGELLKVLLADGRLLDGNLEYQFRKPFDELAKLLGSKEKNCTSRHLVYTLYRQHSLHNFLFFTTFFPT